MSSAEKARAKVSLICTLKDERDSIEVFLVSLLSQSRPADDIVLVDGGSTDGTVEVINSYIKAGAPFRLIIAEGANIPRGRNIGVNQAKYDYIASIDAGCRAETNWLENLIRPLEEDSSVDIVCGFFLPDAKSLFEYCVGELVYPRAEFLNWSRFLPSARSIAFKREAWERVSGYPEWLKIGEDAYFDLEAREVGHRFAYAKDAVVFWRPRPNLWSLFHQYYQYGQGAAQGGFASVYLLQAFGSNVFLFSFRNIMHLLRKRELLPLLFAFIILPTVFLAKSLGVTVGRTIAKVKRG